MSNELPALPEPPDPIDPDGPPPDPERVALLLGITPPDEDQVDPRANLTIHGRPLTEQERELFNACTANDIRAMLQLVYEELKASQERLEAGRAAVALASGYGFGLDVEGEEYLSLGEIRERMTAEDGARFDAFAEIAWPDGYLWFTDHVDTDGD